MRPFLTYLFVLLMSVSTLQAQTVKELEAQRKAALKQLEISNKILNETKKNQRSSLNKLNIIGKSIKERKTLINNINIEINALTNEMQKLETEKKSLELKLSDLKADYVKMVREAYINRSIYAKIMFVVSADNFDQSFRRLRYLQEYSEYRKRQVMQIENTKTKIVEKTNTLADHKNTQEEVVSQKQSEAKKLSQDELNEKVVLKDLTRKEKKLKLDIEAQKKKASEINRKIESIIANEIRKAEEKQRQEEMRRQRLEEAKQTRPSTKTTQETEKPATSTTKRQDTRQTAAPATVAKSNAPVNYTMTREESIEAGNFSGNQGRLPWPVDRGFISGHFGIQTHPVLKFVTTNNKGIYIQTPARSSARAVYDGIVTQRFSIPGNNNAVIVKHGNFRTVYANLTDIFVAVGQKVSTKQNIGRIYTDPDNDNKTELYFQIWKDKSILNPEGWIAR